MWKVTKKVIHMLYDALKSCRRSTTHPDCACALRLAISDDREERGAVANRATRG